MSPHERAPSASALTVLAEGTVELQGRLPWSSNATFLARVCLGGEELHAVYKPHRGEQMLWDFPGGLYRREVAAWELSEALGWGIVPETIARDDGPLGPGSFQYFVPADFGQHYFTLLELPQHDAALRRIATFDLLANNADRKSGHCLLGEGGHIWAIDHGLCFHDEPKLRTVMWDYAGEEIDAALLADIESLRVRGLPPSLAQYLDQAEIAALERRIGAVLRHPVFPHPTSRRAYPWPLV